jgi:hypothetical protein
MVEHQPLNDVLAKVGRFGIRGGHHHALLGLNHAAHLDALEWSVHEFYGTHPARPHRPQSRMITKPGYHNAQLRRGLNHRGFRRNLQLSVIDYKFGHKSVRNITLSMAAPSINKKAAKLHFQISIFY